MAFVVLTKVIDLNTGTPGIRFIESSGLVVSKAYKTKTGQLLYHYTSSEATSQPLGTPIMKDLNLFHAKDNYSYGSEFRASEMLKILEGVKDAEHLVKQIEEILGSDSLETNRTHGWDRSDIC